MTFKSIISRCSLAFFFCTVLHGGALAQLNRVGDIKPAPYPPDAADQVRTYVNPVLAGDHPDPTLLKVGDDFYMCGSSFHFAPNLPVLHSKDLLHWELISRVVPADWDELKSGAPGAGIWQGAITYFYGVYHIYFSNSAGGGQYMASATNPAGPWSAPEKVKTTPDTGPIGYDNSIFVDDDGTPYMIIKPGQTTNRIQQIDHSGHLTGKLINLDWINHDKKYSWAEGPVMCKRDGWYYYFMAGDVTGGQYVLRSRSLVADSTKWENLGKVFAFSKDPDNRFRSANHMSSPFRLNDGTWWCIAQSYDAPKGDDWSGQGRQDLILQVQWTADGRPFVPYPSDMPLVRPNLVNNGLSWRLPRSDEFENPNLSLYWHFLNRNAAMQYSVTDNKGWLTLKPKGGRTHILQKEAGHYYSLITRVKDNVSAAGDGAGLYLTSGNESVNVRLYSGFDEGRKKIIFTMGKQSFSAENNSGASVWLKLERKAHELTGYYSADGLSWHQIGAAINAAELDKAQPDFNSWVGTSLGLFAEGKPANFNLFVYKDGFSEQLLSGANNYWGVTLSPVEGATVNNDAGAWVMLGGVNIGMASNKATRIALTAAALTNGRIEVWIDGLSKNGKKIATIPVKSTGSLTSWSTLSAKIPAISGQHDLYIRIKGDKNALSVKSLIFK
ncbi:family 43 glycosylhydrolase [Mucilaginibacter sp. SMC90]|uniref:family 43 glycosylhydrolase n=1 Tax=Mucilaginibacter sp. SMC90 TaxID=2929803 RepID=UPI001FB545A8|nr:family 43 glycosylhydrolase [Mucilaginibacter sp. SMC90]UOE46561.1 family 43 glycosylhydrolase [Mucilaginibacter sp. SMC90]